MPKSTPPLDPIWLAALADVFSRMISVIEESDGADEHADLLKDATALQTELHAIPHAFVADPNWSDTCKVCGENEASHS